MDKQSFSTLLFFNANTALATRSQPARHAEDFWLLSNFWEQLTSSADDVIGLCFPCISTPVVGLQITTQHHLRLRIWSRNDIGYVLGSPSHSVLVNVRSLDNHNLASGRIDVFVLGSPKCSGADSRAVENGTSKLEHLVDILDFPPHKDNASGSEVFFQHFKKLWTVEVPGKIFDTENHSLRKLG
ncbi:hypothetical protein OGATHE_005097 [Ogataea polymorpha]|uniref:Uncharacterized protein n=1 Tax=Ogataea polymorpha TaxID=460523 RepID=A0A9P8NVZ9_9ASCO|nr:hypothetical protein OGATHE_005097 [Ogataea polymorpha]